MSTFARLCRSAVALFWAAIPLAAPAQGTHRVPQDFPTIQAAINASSTGDTVLVAPGTWYENLTLDTKEITLISSAGPATTTLDGSHLGPVLQITHTPGVATTISGFTIQNGIAPPSPTNFPVITGGGVYATDAGLTVTNSTFQNIIGPSVVASNSTLHLTHSVITTTNGTACTNAGVGQHSGVFITGDSVVTVNGAPVPSTIIGNTISGDSTFCAGAAIQLQGITASTLIQNNVLHDNLGGVDADYAPVYLLQNLIYDNGLGAVSLEGPHSSPSTGPPTTILVNNTMVNNHTSPDTLNGPSTTEIGILNIAAQVALRNNILIGTTQYALLSCANDNPYPTPNDTPLLLDHNDVFNTAGGLLLTGTCFANFASPLSVNGNLSLDPRFISSTNLHPQPGSPVIDAGLNLVDNSLADPSLTDLDGNPRLADATGKGYPIIDLGAYEQVAPPSGAVFAAIQVQPASYMLSPGSLAISINAQALAPAASPTPLQQGTVSLLLNGSPAATASLDSSGHASVLVPFTSPGVYALSATLAAQSGFNPASSPVVYVLVTGPTPTTTTLTLAATPATQTLNQPITLTIHLGSTTSSAPNATAGPVPPGAVTLSEGGTVLSTLQPDATGLATYTIPKPGLGSHTYTVTYAGTTLYPATAATTSVSITAPIATSLTASATPNPAPLNLPVLCQVHVVAASGPAPTGIVRFTDGATFDGFIPLTDSAEQGLVGLPLYNLTLGLHTITVTFTGDPGFSSSTGTCTVNVGGDATATTLTSSKNPAATTDTVTYIATVTNAGTPGATAAPAGSISLSEGSTLLASAPLVPGPGGSGIATLPTTLTLPGLHILTATYLPATAATFTSSATLTETITALPPITTALSANPNPITFGQLTTLAATVTSAASIPTPASITFTDGATILGTVALPATGPATLPVRTLSVGTHQIGAVLHTSDTSAIRSTATPLTLQVNGLPDTLTLAVSPAATAFAAAPVTLSATLAPTADLPAGSTLAGAITFFDGTVPLGTATFAGDGRASFTTATLTPGGHTLTASFGGNLLLASATSAALTEQISANPTATTLSVVPSATTAFAPVTLSARVTSGTSSASLNTLVCTPACAPVTVTFFATSATGLSTLGIIPVDANGNATLSLNPAAGTSSLTAAFSGSPLFAPSSSAPAPLSIAVAPTALTLTANPSPVYQHGTVTLTAALTAPGVPASALAGTVSFLEGATPLGTTSLAAAQAFAYSPGTVGPHTLTAVFSGSGNLAAASATVTVTVLPSDFVVSLKDAALTIATTHHAPTAITISTTGALADQIDLSCANLPPSATCTFAPATHDLTQTTTSTGTLVVDTDALLNYAGAHTPPSPLRRLLHQTGAVLALCLPLGLVATLRRRRSPSSALRARLPHLLAGLLLSVAAVASLTGCSGLYPSHVAPGTYTVTVIGHARTSGIEHSTTLTLVVTQ